MIRKVPKKKMENEEIGEGERECERKIRVASDISISISLVFYVRRMKSENSVQCVSRISNNKNNNNIKRNIIDTFLRSNKF